MPFNSHGRFEVMSTHNIISVKAQGAFNDEGTRAYCQAIEAEVGNMADKPFAVLLDLSQLEGATPGGWEIAERYNQTLAKTKLVGKAVVVKKLLIKAYAEKVNSSILQDRLQVFTDYEAATQWLSHALRTAT